MVYIEIPKDVSLILSKLRASGYEAYAVGGCVRDSLLGKEPKDWDITTSALPLEVKEIFTRTVDTGIKHGTVTVLVNGTGYEVTTYRVDGEYLDGRHPEEVSFTASLDEDLKRRDFTINAFVYNEAEGVKDLFDGLKDLECGIIRCVGVPEERFGEDALRILRAIRFAATLHFSIEPETYNAAKKLAANLSKVSAERIKIELEKTLTSANPDYICFLKDLGIDRVILKELEKVEDTEPLNKALKASGSDPSVRWAVLGFFMERANRLSESGEAFKEVMRRLKFDNRTLERILKFLRTYALLEDNKDFEKESFRISVKRLLNRLGTEDAYMFLDFAYALGMGTGCYVPLLQHVDRDSIYGEIEDITKKNECFLLKQLAVNGRDLMEAGITKGKELGEMLDRLLEAVIISPEKNTREYLLDAAKTYGY